MVSANGAYTIALRPVIRDAVPDIFIRYNLTRYTATGPNGTYANPGNHTECQPYVITWCGDGVVDTPNSGASWSAEACDDGANNGKP